MKHCLVCDNQINNDNNTKNKIQEKSINNTKNDHLILPTKNNEFNTNQSNSQSSISSSSTSSSSSFVSSSISNSAEESTTGAKKVNSVINRRNSNSTNSKSDFITSLKSATNSITTLSSQLTACSAVSTKR